MSQMSKLVFVFHCFFLHVAAGNSGVLTLAGDMPKMLWGGVEQPVCELILDRENTRLKSTCPLFTVENDELKAKVATLEAVVAELNTENAEMKTELTELKTWKTGMEVRMEPRVADD